MNDKVIYLCAFVLPMLAYVMLHKVVRGTIVTVGTLILLSGLYGSLLTNGFEYFTMYIVKYGYVGLVGMMTIPVIAFLIPVIDVHLLLRKKEIVALK